MIVKDFNRKIPSFLAIIVILILALIVGGFTYRQYSEMEKEEIYRSEIEIPEKKIKTSNEFLEVVSPIPHQEITSPVSVSGRSSFFEGNTRIRVKDNSGEILATTFTTAKGWMGKLHPFSKNVYYVSPYSREGIVEVFEESAKDGTEINKIIIPVIFKDYLE